MADGIIGSVGVAVVPNADNFWRDFKAKTEAGADNAAPKVKVEADTSEAEAKLAELKAEISRTSGSVNVKVNSTGADKATQEMHLLRDSILLLGPSLVPVGGVAVGVLAGLLPVAAALALGVKGVTAEFNDGSLAGTKYGQEIGTLKGEYLQLQAVAAGGLLKGLDTTFEASESSFGAFNQQIGATSTQIGNIAGHVVPGLLSVLTQLEPLFLTIGSSVDHGAESFQKWASSGDGVSKFLAYAEAELPIVEQNLGQLLELVLHLTAGLNPFGNTALRTLGLVSTLINQIPIGILSKLETVVLSGYAAWRTYGAITGIINGVNSKIAAHAALVANNALVDKAATTASAAAFAEEASAVAAAQAEEAAAVAASQEAIAASLAGTGSILEATASEAAASAAEFAAAMQVEADAAAAMATETAASAAAAADAVDTAGAAAAAGWTAALGPIGALVVGVGLLSATLFGNKSANEAAAQAAQSYATSVRSSTDSLSAANIAQTNKNLSDKGALKNLSDLTAANSGLGISNIQLALAVNGTQSQYSSVTDTLKSYIASLGVAAANGKITGATFRAQSDAANSLLSTLSAQRTGLQNQILTQTQLNQLNEASIGITDAQAVSQAALFGQVGTTGVAAYLAAEQAAQSNTASTQAQTLAFQLENNAASLLSTALQGLAGDNLNTAQAQTSLAQANLGVASSFKTNGTAIDGNKAKAVANQQAIQGNVTAAEQLAEAVGKQTGSTKDSLASLAASKKALEDQLAAHKELTPAVQAYIDKLYDLSALKVPPTKLDVDDAAAAAALKSLQLKLDALENQRKVTLGVDTSGDAAKIAALQILIDKLHGKTVTAGLVATSTSTSGHGTAAHAAGGSVSDGYFTVGEQGYELGFKQGSHVQIFSNKQSKAMTGMNSVPGYASGTSFTGAGGTQYASELSAINSFVRAATALDKVTAALLKDADASKTTTAQLKADADAVAAAAKKNGDSVSILKALASNEKSLVAAGTQRDAVLAKLGTQTSTSQTAYDKLAADQQTLTAEVQTVSQAVTNGFNIQTAGQYQFTNGQTYSSYGTTLSSLQNQVAAAQKFQTELAKLGKEFGSSSAGTSLLQQLAEGGVSGSGQEVDALAGATPQEIAQLVAQYAKLQAIGGATGSQVAKIVDGAAVVKDESVVNALTALDKSLSSKIATIGSQMAAVLNGTTRAAKAGR